MLLQKIGKKKVLLGYKGMLLCLYKKLYLWFFSRYFNFHRWHTSAPYECRPYKNIVSKKINTLSKKGIVEVGCGLGDIGNLISNQLFYFGIDSEENTIVAARYFLRKKRNIKLYIGSFEAIREISTNQFDVLLLINWIHEIETSVLVKLIICNINKNVKYIVLDSIHLKDKKIFNGFNHNEKNLLENGLPFKLKETINNIDETRHLLIFEKN